MLNAFPHDYDLSKLIKVNTGFFNFFVTPRYVQHYEIERYEHYSSHLVKHFLLPGELFMDVGAHYGYYSILAGTQVPNVNIVAVEPVLENFEILKRNLVLNSIKKIELHNLAVSNSNSVKEFNVTEASDSAGFYEHPNTRSLKKISVNTQTIINILRGRKVGFIKIDVEGHELFVLEQFEEITKNNPNVRLLVEFNPECLNKCGVDPNRLLSRLKDLGFDIYFIQEDLVKHSRYESEKCEWEKMLEGTTYCNLLCLPSNKSSSITVFSHSSDLGGAELSLLDTVTMIQSHFVLPHIVLPDKGPVTAILESNGISYDVIPYNWWASLNNPVKDSVLLNGSGELADHIELVNRINSHLIYTNTSVIPWGGILAKQLGKPHIWEISEFGDLDHKLIYNPQLNEVKKIINDLSDKVIFISKTLQEYYSQAVDENKSILLYYNVQINDEKVNEKSIKIYNFRNSHKFLILGFVKESKGQDQAVNAIISLLEKGEDLELAIVGPTNRNDQYRHLMQSSVPIRWSNRIHFIEPQANPYPIIKQCNTLLVCSANEAYGRVTIEGMYLGKMVIASNSGALPEVVKDNENGLLYKSGDVKSLEKVMVKILRDAELHSRLALNGKLWAEKTVNKTDRLFMIAKIIHQVCRNHKEQCLPFYQRMNSKILTNLVSKNCTLIENNEKIITEAERVSQLFSKSRILTDNLLKQLHERDLYIQHINKRENSLQKIIKHLYLIKRIHQITIMVLLGLFGQRKKNEKRETGAKKRIAFFTERLMTGFGVDLVVDNQARLLSKNNDVTVFAISIDQNFIQSVPYKVVPLSVPLSFNPIKQDKHMLWYYFDNRTMFANYDTYVINTPTFNSIIPMLSNLGWVVIQYFGNSPSQQYSGFSKYRKALMDSMENYIYFNYADKIISISDYLQKELWSKHRKKTVTIHLGSNHVCKLASDLSDNQHNEVRKNYYVHVNSRYLTYVGRLDYKNNPYKNTSLLMKLIDEINIRQVSAKIYAIGYPENNVEEEMYAKGICVIPKANNIELVSMLSHSYLHISPSLWEGFNLPLLEAQALGVPVIAYNTAAHPEVVDNGESGFLVDTEDEFINKTLDLINNDELRSKMASRAKIFASNFTWEKNISELIKYL